MSKNRDTFLNTDPLDEITNDEYDALNDTTKDLLDNIIVYDPCIDCNKSQHSVENKLITYKLNNNSLNKSREYNCGRCEYNKDNNNTKRKT